MPHSTCIKTNMKCDIIIPVWNQKDITKDCVDSIVKNTSYPYRLILIDNASDNDTKRYLEGVRDNKAYRAIIRDKEAKKDGGTICSVY